jgi:hypothetical protein
LLQVCKQGRHKYFSLANEDVASVLEALMGITAGNGKIKSRTGPADAALRHSRVCYNHLAGDAGIRLYDSLVVQGYLFFQNDALTLTPSGSAFACDFGIDIEELKAARAVLCRECLDWSELRSHLAGSLGRAFLTRFEKLRWVKRIDDSRIIKFSRKGADSFNSIFGVQA